MRSGWWSITSPTDRTRAGGFSPNTFGCTSTRTSASNSSSSSGEIDADLDAERLARARGSPAAGPRRTRSAARWCACDRAARAARSRTAMPSGSGSGCSRMPTFSRESSSARSCDDPAQVREVIELLVDVVADQRLAVPRRADRRDPACRRRRARRRAPGRAPRAPPWRSRGRPRAPTAHRRWRARTRRRARGRACRSRPRRGRPASDWKPGGRARDSSSRGTQVSSSSVAGADAAPEAGRLGSVADDDAASHPSPGFGSSPVRPARVGPVGPDLHGMLRMPAATRCRTTRARSIWRGQSSLVWRLGLPGSDSGPGGTDCARSACRVPIHFRDSRRASGPDDAHSPTASPAIVAR